MTPQATGAFKQDAGATLVLNYCTKKGEQDKNNRIGHVEKLIQLKAKTRDATKATKKDNNNEGKNRIK